VFLKVFKATLIISVIRFILLRLEVLNKSCFNFTVILVLLFLIVVPRITSIVFYLEITDYTFLCTNSRDFLLGTTFALFLF